MAPEFWFSISRALGTVVVTTHGVLGTCDAILLGDVLRDLVDNQGNMAVVVDLHDLLGLSPRCVEVLGVCAASAARRGAAVQLADPGEHVERIIADRGQAHLISHTPRLASRASASSIHPVGGGSAFSGHRAVNDRSGTRG